MRLLIVSLFATFCAGALASPVVDTQTGLPAGISPATITIDRNWRFEQTVNEQNAQFAADSIMDRMRNRVKEQIKSPVTVIYGNCRIDKERLKARSLLMSHLIGTVTVTCEAALDMADYCDPELPDKTYEWLSQGFKTPLKFDAIEDFEALGGKVTPLEEGGWQVQPPPCPGPGRNR